ncbi:NAD(P)-dependent oxidoreductase [Methylopila jiangsuensis]|uniref:NAD(P)-dependent oxidoreductase n=1 Tax=Methylopila jiangsuensis TaxID=586230 RepID=A0A9W6JG97_9HYPH|nr:SDR family oxidoreductase [Methylopila jiangsuensis]MDR6286968.1 nucleoside-diphosphate-sugar epimerase [Methylopila jiangsuensis]GLK76682.1 NAD(P)-dependent oxidoreductase [Methylopila jiangsuensis]
MRRLVVIGCGYTARRFVALHGAGFDAVDVTARSPDKAAALAADGLRAHSFDGSSLAPALKEALERATHLLVSAPPDDHGDPTLRAARDVLRSAPDLAWIGYLSTIGVYADAGGGWVDEATPPEADSVRGARRIAVEREWLALGRDAGVAVQVFRLAGIYGPGRNQIENLKAGTAKRLVKPGQVFNRIHVDDIATALAAGIARPQAGPIVNVTDDEPAPPQDVVAYAAELLGVPPPPEAAFETADISPMARSFYSSNKRVANRALREAFGVALAYPTYREGIAALTREG